MKPFEKLEQASAPDGTILTLYRHDGAYHIRVNGIELMSTRRSNSERALAELACDSLRTRREAHVLIGGLGFGFTLRAALELLPDDATVVVAELLPQVVLWNRNPEYALAHDALNDARVRVVESDVSKVLQRGRGSFDAILMDVDNGAESFTTGGNAKLYSDHGIYSAIAALKPDGVLAYWSATAEPAFVHALKQAGMDVTSHSRRAHTSAGAYHTIIVATQRAATNVMRGQKA